MPTANEETVQVAVPELDSGTVPSSSFPRRNETEPDLTTAPVVVKTDAVKVTGRPRVLGLGDPATMVTVENGTTSTAIAGLAEPTIPQLRKRPRSPRLIPGAATWW